MISSRVRIGILSLSCLGFSACAGTEIEMPGVPATEIETAAMPITDQQTPAPPLPLIDAEAPTEYQTATFALG